VTAPPVATACFVYGVVPADLELPTDLVGVGGIAPTTVTSGSVAAVVGEVPAEPQPARRDDLLAYSRVVDELAAAGPVVPIQFGSILSDAESVVDELLTPQQEDFERMLGQLAGRAQFNLRATYVETAVLAEVMASEAEVRELSRRTRERPEDASYADRIRLGELVAHAVEARSGQDADMLLDAVLPFADAHAFRSGPSTQHILDLALLVENTRRQEFEEHLEALAAEVHDLITLRLVGPIAPYDFVGGID
jgi:hypothetical protein